MLGWSSALFGHPKQLTLPSRQKQVPQPPATFGVDETACVLASSDTSQDIVQIKRLIEDACWQGPIRRMNPSTTVRGSFFPAEELLLYLTG